MTAKGKLRTSYEFSPENKVRLTELKLDLKRKGLVGVSEATILEALIAGARLKDLEAKFRNAQEALRQHRSIMLLAAAAAKAPKKPRRRR
jgi:hypothetical protein